MGYKAILFDLDGTLIDSTELIIKSFQHTCDLHLNRRITAEEVYPYFGRPLRGALEELGSHCVDQLLETYRTYNLKHHDKLITVFPGVVSTVKALHKQGVKMAIVTSKTEETALRGLRLFALDDYFTVIIGLESTSKHKPDPAPVILALERLKVQSGQALMVGDSPFDLRSARAAGIKTAAVRWSALPWLELAAEQPDYILEQMADLGEIILLPGLNFAL